jgi:transporter family-2 protein
MESLLVAVTIGVGMLMPAQAGVNATFREYAGHPLLAGVLNFSVGLLVLAGASMAIRVPWPTGAVLSTAPWWSWLGGVCGASVVVVSIIAAPRLGAAMMMACLVTGLLFGSVVLDHFGLVGYPVRPVTLSRVAGIGLLLAGVLLIQRSS